MPANKPTIPFEELHACMAYGPYDCGALDHYNANFCKSKKPNKSIKDKVLQTIYKLSTSELEEIRPMLAHFMHMTDGTLDMLLCGLSDKPSLNNLYEYKSLFSDLLSEDTDTAFVQLKIARSLCNDIEICDYNGLTIDAYMEKLKSRASHGYFRTPTAWAPPPGAQKLPMFSVSDGWAAYDLWVAPLPSDGGAIDPKAARDPDAPIQVIRHSVCPVTGDNDMQAVSSRVAWAPEAYSGRFIYRFCGSQDPCERAARKLAYVSSAADNEDCRGMGVRTLASGCVEWMPRGEATRLAWADPSKYCTQVGKRKHDCEGALQDTIDRSTHFRRLQYTKHAPDGSPTPAPSVVDGRVQAECTKGDAVLWVSNAGVFLEAKGDALPAADAWGKQLTTRFVQEQVGQDAKRCRLDGGAEASKVSSGLSLFMGRPSGDYLHVSWKGFTGAVHQAVAQTFLGEPPNGDYATYSVDHVRNSAKHDNFVRVDDGAEGESDATHASTNLRWASPTAQAKNRKVCGVDDGRSIDAEETPATGISPADLERLRAACHPAARERLQSRLSPTYEAAVLRFLVDHGAPCDLSKVIAGLQAVRWEEVPAEAWRSHLPRHASDRPLTEEEKALLVRAKGLNGDKWCLFKAKLQMHAHYTNTN